MVEALRVPETELGDNDIRPHAVDPDGNIYAGFGLTEQSFVKIDGGSLRVVASATFGDQIELDVVSAYTLTGRIDFVLALGFLQAPARIFFAEDPIATAPTSSSWRRR